MTGDSFTQRSVGSGRETARFADYVGIARLDHATKHVFILPGLVPAYMLHGVRTDSPIQSIVFGLAAALLVASANYVINILLVPLIAILFGHYFALAMRPGSSAQAPEKLFRERGLMFLVAATGAHFALTTLIDIPALAELTERRYITLP